jgi:ubiquinol-cytochrome c reductase cytochrome b subunit
MKKEVEIKNLPIEEKERLVREGKMNWFFPDHVVEQVIICLFIFVFLITLATLFPPHLGEQADPFNTPDHIKPEWYFLAPYQVLIIAEKFSFLGAWAPKLLGIGAPGVVILLIFLVPFIDRNPERAYAKRNTSIAVGILSAIGYLFLTLWGHFS